MNKYFKYTLFIFAGFAVLLAAAAAYIAATFDANRHKSHLIKFVKEQKQRDLKLDGDMALSFFPGLGVNVSKISLSEHNSANEFATVENVRVSLAFLPLLKKQIVVNEFAVKGLKATLVKRKNGDMNIVDLAGGRTDKTPPSEQFTFDVDRVLLENATLVYRDEQKNTRQSIEGIHFKLGRSGPFDLAMTVKSNQPKLNLAVKAGGAWTMNAATRDFNAKNLSLTVTSGGNRVDITSAELTGTLDTQQFNLPKLSVKLAVENAGLPGKAVHGVFNGNATLDLVKQRAALNLNGKLIDSNIKAKFNLAGFAPPAIQFAVEVDDLDVDKWLPPQPSAAATPAANALDKPLDFSMLKSFNAAGSLQIGTLKAANIKAAKTRLNIKSHNGKLDINPLTATLYEGTMQGSMTINAQDNSIAVRQNLTGINIAPLLKDLANKDMLEGRGNITLDVRGMGTSVAALKKSLAGQASLHLTDGAIKGINLAESLRKAKSMLGAAKGEQGQMANKAEKTDFSELKASFAIKDGVAHNQDLSMKSPLLRVSGDGNINLGLERVDYLVKAMLVATAAGQEGKEAGELRGITIPVRVSGPYSAIRYQLDFSGAVAEAAQQKIDAKKEDLKNKLGDKLRSLFR